MIRRNRAISVIFSVILGACVSNTGATATTLIRMDLKALAQSAQIILRARCVGSVTRWESGSIWTFDDFQVLESFKGAPPRILRVRLPGGRVGHVETRIEGVPYFFQGEEAVLFVEKTSAGDYGVTGWAQGTFRVHRESAGGEPRLTQDTSGVAVFDPATRQFSPTGIRNLSLSDFRRLVAAAVSATPQNRRQR